ncbi:hypothetical protein [Rhizobium leguminosarum]|uniref:hypothetical protein n=1 Tax=Rhizobium leguminosarum TaxID=384 RepID=UPI00103E6124|nr:hypothetical protein [Rhizobium leguminosarum]TBY27428.1 hypothetical protein E0H55_27440 [Rhizobium leguminosarum bv. viciae]
MVSEFKWTTEGAVGNFVRLLEQARKFGPQEIHDETGIYVLRVQDDATKEDAAEFLLKSRPSG